VDCYSKKKILEISFLLFCSFCFVRTFFVGNICMRISLVWHEGKYPEMKLLHAFSLDLTKKDGFSIFSICGSM
jgi:hypothetical protein